MSTPSTPSNTPNIDLPPGLSDDEETVYRQSVQDFFSALPPETTPNIFLLKALHNAAAHAVTCHRANRVLHALDQLPSNEQDKQRSVQARLLAQAARNTQITTKLLDEIESRWPAEPPAPPKDDASYLGKYGPYLSRFQDLMDQIDIEETARELGCEPHEVPGLPIRIPYPKDTPQEHPQDLSLFPHPSHSSHPSYPSDPSDDFAPPLPPLPPPPPPKPILPIPLVYGF